MNNAYAQEQLPTDSSTAVAISSTQISSTQLIDTQSTALMRPLIADNSLIAAPLSDFIYYFPDSQGLLAVDDVINMAKYFIPIQNKSITMRAKTHWYWLRVKNPNANLATWFINTGVSTPSLLRAYWLHGDTPNTEWRQIASSHTHYSYPSLLLPLELQPLEEGHLLIEYQSVANFPLMLTLNDANQLLKKGPRLHLTSGVYLGAMCILFLFFFTQFIINRNRVYFYYSMFVFFTILTVLQITGTGFNLLPELIDLNPNLRIAILGGGIYTFYFLFSTDFFQFKKNNPFLHKVFISLAATVCTLTLAAFAFSTDYLLSMTVAFGLPWPIVGAVWALRKKYPSAVFFLAGSTAHCITTYFLLLGCLGLETSRNNFIFIFACMGLLFDILCFAVAIIYQNNQLRLEYNRQLQERIHDLQILTESEQVSAKALMLSKQTLLNMAATAHDLQQPLSSMQLLLSTKPHADPLMEHIQTALNYAKTMLHSVLGDTKQNYLAITEWVEAKNFLQAVLQRHQSHAQHKNIAIQLHCQPLHITCLPLVLHRILDNLLSNAYKYTSSGKILISGRKRNKADFLIQIWDTGQGMDKNQVNTLTAPFTQLTTIDSDNRGFGLGLFIVKSLCNHAGYQFDIRSQKGRGSCISILLPNATAHYASHFEPK